MSTKTLVLKLFAILIGGEHYKSKCLNIGSSLKEHVIWTQKLLSGPKNSCQNVAGIRLTTAGGSCNINMHCMCSFRILLPHNVSRHEYVN